jgi:uncharacterized protein (TIGR03437 family)
MSLRRIHSSRTMPRPLLGALAALSLGIGSARLPAQTRNQVANVGFTSTSVAPDLPTAALGTVLTLFISDLGVPDAVATDTPLPRSLSGVVVAARVVGAIDTTGYPRSLPILRVDTVHRTNFFDGGGPPCTPADNLGCSYTAVTVQIPTERVCAQPNGAPPRNCTDPSQFQDLPPLLVLNVESNGYTGPDLSVRVVLASPHLLSSCDSIFGPQSTGCAALVSHVDGSLVDVNHPARFGETIILYAVGLGSGVPTGQATKDPMPPASFCCASVTFTSMMSLNDSVAGHPWGIQTDTLIRPDYVGLVPGYVGLFQINVRVPPPFNSGSVPASLFRCSSDLGAATNTSIILGTGSNSIAICVQE